MNDSAVADLAAIIYGNTRINDAIHPDSDALAQRHIGINDRIRSDGNIFTYHAARADGDISAELRRRRNNRRRMYPRRMTLHRTGIILLDLRERRVRIFHADKAYAAAVYGYIFADKNARSACRLDEF